MKKMLLAVMAVLFVAALMTACTTREETFSKEAFAGDKLEGLKVVVDAGHGGFDGGTQGVESGVYESKVNLAIAVLLKNTLENSGATVVMTRTGEDAIAETKDGDMQLRADIIREAKPDIMVSIHQNRYEDASVCGPQVFYLMRGTQAEMLALMVQRSLNEALDIKKPRIQMSGGYKILRPGEGPSIIVECGFLSNPKEDRLLQDPEYQLKLVKAIVEGMRNYISAAVEIPV